MMGDDVVAGWCCGDGAQRVTQLACCGAGAGQPPAFLLSWQGLEKPAHEKLVGVLRARVHVTEQRIVCDMNLQMGIV